jgi:predicted Zn-dependent peptidase
VSLALLTGKLLLDDRAIETLEQLFKRIDAIKPSELTDTANELFNSANLSSLVFKGEGKEAAV